MIEKWFGTPGHFICARWCRYHMLTQIGEYMISTIGEYVHPRHSMGSEMAERKWMDENWPGEDIGFDRKYETMVFKAGLPCTLKECGCGCPDIDGDNLEMIPANNRRDAQAGHYAMIEKYRDIQNLNERSI